MKKIAFVSAILLTLALLSCSKKADVAAMPDEFIADVVISVNETDFFATYEKRSDLDRLTFTAPASLCGIKLTLKDGVTTAEIGDVTFDSEALNAAFDFLPVTNSGEKTAGIRNYKITIKERL